MALTTAYLTSTKYLDDILTAITSAQAPDRFTIRFLEELGFTSKSDRLIIGVLKAVGFLDETGMPQDRYFRYLDQSEAERVLAEGVREAYDDLFRINKSAHEMSTADVANKLKTLTQGQKSETVIAKMATTFGALCSLADFERPADHRAEEQPVEKPDEPNEQKEGEKEARLSVKSLGLSYDIHIHLPAARDRAVYDALFRSLRDHLV